MERREFLALLASPALAALLQACGDDGAGQASTTTAVPGTGEARSALARLTADPADAVGAARAVNALGADLYGKLAATGAANVVFSPASILVALAMTRGGAVGRTAEEMDAVLHVVEAGPDPGAIHPALNSLTAALERRSGRFRVEQETFEVTLAVANSLWGQVGITWVPAFLDLLASQYGAGLRLVDYGADPEAARAAINAWVAAATQQRITELLRAGSITPDVRLTLVNAIYLKAPWLEPFPDQGTRDGSFSTVAGTTVSVPVMHTTQSLGYASSDGWQAVQLPYVGGSLAMLLVVPDVDGLAAVEAGLATGLLDEAVAGLETRDVALAMPRFDLETKVDLNAVMSALGMPTAFDPDRADFSGMTLEERLFIGLVVHQANITVDEKGTEAAAATAVVMRPTSAPEPVTLTIDRPFLYAVRDVPTGAVLFLGRVGDPS